MTTLAYPFEVRDSANTTTDNRKTGLTPTVSNGKTIAASPATVLASTVAIVETTGGHYAALYDAETNGDASFPIDNGSALTNVNDRYITLDLTRDSGRILTSLPNAAPAASGGLPTFGTGTGQINPASGKVPATLASTDVTGNVAADLQTIKTQAVTAVAGVTFPASIGTSTYAGGDTSGTTTLLGRITGPLAPTTGDAYARIGANGAGLTSVALAAAGLDAISMAEPASGPPTTFREWLVWVFRRLGGQAARAMSGTSGTLAVKKGSGAAWTSQAITDDGAGAETQGAAS